jgi:AraC-like DNA-binding protein
VNSGPARLLAPYIARPGSHIIVFHLISEGRAYVRVGEETTPLAAGDIVMFPHGDPHLMGNGSGGEIMDSASQIPELLTRQLELSSLGGGGEATALICGYLACEAGLIRPAIACLPHVVRVPIRTDAAGEWLENSIRYAVSQAASAPPGGEVILARLAEVLFTETLRRYLTQLPAERTGWLAGARDPTVGRSLAALHRKPAHAWTLEELAHEAGVSRSALTERFARYLGQSPIAYLADWRLELGADAMRTTSRSVLQVASEVGYESEAAFNRAFKRRFGQPPAQYRRTFREQRPGATARAAS